MKQFKRQITATVGSILIALGLIGINAEQAIAQGKARKGAKVRSGSSAKIISPRDSASGLPTGKRIDTSGTTSSSGGNVSAVSGFEDLLVSQAKGKSNATRRSAGNGNGRASYDLRKAKP